MEIKKVKVGELISFVESDTFRRLHPKPITELRAISQFNNPDANPEQTALIYITKENEVLGFAGLLPHKINKTGETIYSNSCWWAHPEKGRGLAIPLMMKVIEESGQSLYFSETTPELKAIVEKTRQFYFDEATEGIRGFIRFYLSDILRSRSPSFRPINFLFRFVDFLLNLITSPYRWLIFRKYKNHGLEVEKVESINSESATFLSEKGLSNFIRHTPKNFDWYQKYPWIKAPEEKEPYSYPFTHYVKTYELNIYKLHINGNIKALVAITYRDNLAKIPYFLFEESFKSKAVSATLSIILKKKYNSLIVWHPVFTNFLKKHKFPFLFRQKHRKFTGVTKNLAEIFKENPFLQDGDGDSIFT